MKTIYLPFVFVALLSSISCHNDKVKDMEERIADSSYRILPTTKQAQEESVTEIQSYTEAEPNEPKVSSSQNNTLSNDENAWLEAKKKNTLYAYQKYLMEFPNGEFASLAQDKITSLNRNKPTVSESQPEPRVTPMPTPSPEVPPVKNDDNRNYIVAKNKLDQVGFENCKSNPQCRNSVLELLEKVLREDPTHEGAITLYSAVKFD